MAVTIMVPTVLLSYTRGRRTLECAGATVDELLNELAKDHAGLVATIRSNGTLCRFMNIYLNGKDVRYRDGLSTPLTHGDELRVLPAVAGG